MLEKMKKMERNTGFCNAFLVMSCGLVLFIAFTKLVYLMCFFFILLVGFLIANYLFFEGGVFDMKRIVFKVFGIDLVNMKVNALAEYLKIKFVHIPEHYKCEKITK